MLISTLSLSLEIARKIPRGSPPSPSIMAYLPITSIVICHTQVGDLPSFETAVKAWSASRVPVMLHVDDAYPPLPKRPSSTNQPSVIKLLVVPNPSISILRARASNLPTPLSLLFPLATTATCLHHPGHAAMLLMHIEDGCSISLTCEPVPSRTGTPSLTCGRANLAVD